MTKAEDAGPPASIVRKGRVLIVDDDRALVETLSEGLSDLHFDVTGVNSSRQAAAPLGDDYDVVLTDLRMPQLDRMGVLAASKHAMRGAPGDRHDGVERGGLRRGVHEARRASLHHKPFRVDELALFLTRAVSEYRLRREARALRRAVRDSSALENVIGDAPAMRDRRNLTRRLADADAPVLITGETSTGKGLVARALHAEGSRAGALFVTVNCAALRSRRSSSTCWSVASCVADLPRTLSGEPQGPLAFSGDVVSLEAVQQKYAAWALAQLGGRRMATAEALDIDPKTLARLLST